MSWWVIFFLAIEAVALAGFLYYGLKASNEWGWRVGVVLLWLALMGAVVGMAWVLGEVL